MSSSAWNRSASSAAAKGIRHSPRINVKLSDLPDVFGGYMRTYDNLLRNIIKKIWLVSVDHADAFITRYTMDSQVQLLPHIDQSSIVSMTIKLNRGYEGGELHFVRQKLVNDKVPVGYLAFFPSGCTHVHEVLPLKSGKRYANHAETRRSCGGFNGLRSALGCEAMIVLGIETSCDETAAAVVDERRRILSNRVLSQDDEHRPYGGVVPEIAARSHLDHIERLVRLALEDAHLDFTRIDGVAATAGPGLIGGVFVGVMTASPAGTASFSRSRAWVAIGGSAGPSTMRWARPSTRRPSSWASAIRADRRSKRRHAPATPIVSICRARCWGGPISISLSPA
jgi:hypothetical protein